MINSNEVFDYLVIFTKDDYVVENVLCVITVYLAFSYRKKLTFKR